MAPLLWLRSWVVNKVCGIRQAVNFNVQYSFTFGAASCATCALGSKRFLMCNEVLNHRSTSELHEIVFICASAWKPHANRKVESIRAKESLQRSAPDMWQLANNLGLRHSSHECKRQPAMHPPSQPVRQEQHSPVQALDLILVVRAQLVAGRGFIRIESNCAHLITCVFIFFLHDCTEPCGSFAHLP